MKLLKWIVIALAGLAVLLFGGGALLPQKFSVSRSLVIQAAPDRVFALIENPRRWKDWSAWNQRDPAMQITYAGATSGAGAVWSWKSASEGDGRMTFVSADPGRRLAYELHFVDFGSTSTGELRLAPQGLGTRVTWVMNGDTGSNPLRRWMTLFADGLLGKDFDAGLAQLKTLAERP